MGFKMRKSFKIAPGVRMTVTPRGVSASVGVNGARITAHSSGRVTGTAGIPGTGISSTRRLNSAASQRKSAAPTKQRAVHPVKPTAAPPVPGIMAPKWEKELYKVLFKGGDKATLAALSHVYPEAARLFLFYDFVAVAAPSGEVGRIRISLEWLRAVGFIPEREPIIQKYSPNLSLTVPVAGGITVTLPATAQTLGLVLAEAQQEMGDLHAAIALVESLEPDTVAAVSLAELYVAQHRWADVVTMTNGVVNEDEPSMYLLIQRGAALREQGYGDAAREALKEALRLRSRPAGLRHLALIERGQSYLADGKIGMARKDFEKVLAEDSAYPGLISFLAAVPRN